MKPVVEPKKEEKAPMTMRGKLDPKTCIGTLTVKVGMERENSISTPGNWFYKQPILQASILLVFL